MIDYRALSVPCNYGRPHSRSSVLGTQPQEAKARGPGPLAFTSFEPDGRLARGVPTRQPSGLILGRILIFPDARSIQADARLPLPDTFHDRSPVQADGRRTAGLCPELSVPRPAFQTGMPAGHGKQALPSSGNPLSPARRSWMGWPPAYARGPARGIPLSFGSSLFLVSR